MSCPRYATDKDTFLIWKSFIFRIQALIFLYHEIRIFLSVPTLLPTNANICSSSIVINLLDSSIKATPRSAISFTTRKEWTIFFAVSKLESSSQGPKFQHLYSKTVMRYLEKSQRLASHKIFYAFFGDVFDIKAFSFCAILYTFNS